MSIFLYESRTFRTLPFKIVLQKEGRSFTLEPILLIKRDLLNGHFHPIQMASFPSRYHFVVRPLTPCAIP